MIDPPGIDELGDYRARNHGIDPLRDGDVGTPKPAFPRQRDRPNYVFKGLKPFIDDAAAKAAYPDHSLRSQMHGDWFVKQVSNALGNASCQRDARGAQGQIDRAVSLRQIMAIALAATDAAIIEAARGLNLPDPPFACSEEDHGPRHVRRPKHPGQ